jgi:glycosyltransferase involved in cell wall biosynthesis
LQPVSGAPSHWEVPALPPRRQVVDRTSLPPPYRILRLITWLPAGGIERKIAAVLPRMNRDMFEPHVCCIRERGPLADEIENSGIPVHVIPFRSRWDPAALWRLGRLVEKLQVDLIHAHMYRANVPATAVKIRHRRIAVIAHYHNVNTWETKWQLLTDRVLARMRDLNLAVSEAVRQDVIAKLGLRPDSVRTMHNGVDTDEFRPLHALDREQMRAELGIPADAVAVVMAARLVPQKNHALVLRTASHVLAASPSTRFVFAGSGPEELALRQMAAHLGIEHAVSFIGHRTDICRVMAACDVSVLPSFREGFSNTVLESMACGLPVLASDVGGNREIIDRGINGHLIEANRLAGSTEAASIRESQYVRCLKRLVMDADLRARMSVAARRTAEGFGLDTMVRSVQDVYMEILANRQ